MSRSTPRATLRDPAALLIRRAEALRRHAPRALDGDPSGVHQARVASRRLREAVPVLTAGQQGLGRNRTLRRLRRLTRALGAIRDLDVTLDLIHELGARDIIPAADFDDLRAQLEQERARTFARRRKALARIDIGKVRRRLRVMSEAVRSAPPDEWRRALGERLVTRSQALSAAVSDAGHLYDSERLHQVRIATKKLRYALELAGETGAVAATDPTRGLRLVQEILGRLHDVQVLETHLAAMQADREVHTGDRDLGIAARRLERECRHLHAKYLSMAPALDRAAASARQLAPSLARKPRRRPLKVALTSRARRARTPKA